MGGRGLKNSGNRLVEKIVGDELTFSFVSQNQSWFDMCTFFGAIVKNDGDTCTQIIMVSSLNSQSTKIPSTIVPTPTWTDLSSRICAASQTRSLTASVAGRAKSNAPPMPLRFSTTVRFLFAKKIAFTVQLHRLHRERLSCCQIIGSYGSRRRHELERHESLSTLRLEGTVAFNIFLRIKNPASRRASSETTNMTVESLAA